AGPFLVPVSPVLSPDSAYVTIIVAVPESRNPAVDAAASLRVGGPLHGVECGLADEVAGDLGRREIRQADIGLKHTPELSPSKPPGKRRCGMAMGIKDIDAVVMFGVGGLNVSVGEGGTGFGTGIPGPDRVQPGGISRSSRTRGIIRAADIRDGHQ